MAPRFHGSEALSKILCSKRLCTVNFLFASRREWEVLSWFSYFLWVFLVVSRFFLLSSPYFSLRFFISIPLLRLFRFVCFASLFLFHALIFFFFLFLSSSPSSSPTSDTTIAATTVTTTTAITTATSTFTTTTTITTTSTTITTTTSSSNSSSTTMLLLLLLLLQLLLL